MQRELYLWIWGKRVSRGREQDQAFSITVPTYSTQSRIPNNFIAQKWMTGVIIIVDRKNDQLQFLFFI